MFLVKFVLCSTNYIRIVIVTCFDDRKMAEGKEKGTLLQTGQERGVQVKGSIQVKADKQKI